MQALINTGMVILSVTEGGQVHSPEKLEGAEGTYVGAGKKYQRGEVKGAKDRDRGGWWEKLGVRREFELCDTEV